MAGEVKFYDTNALLNGYEGLKNESCIYMSSITLKELENIKVSSKKDQDVKYKARKATRFLKENNDKYKCIVAQDKHYNLLKEMNLEVDNDNLIMATAFLLGKEIGKKVTVVKLHGKGVVKRRIMDMGITKGVEIFVRKLAPLGDPIEVNIRNYELTLRKADAEMIEVK